MMSSSTQIPLRVIPVQQELQTIDLTEARLRQGLKIYESDNSAVNGFLEGIVKDVVKTLKGNDELGLNTVIQTAGVVVEAIKNAPADKLPAVIKEGNNMVFQAAKDAGAGQFVLNQRLMNQIVREMKEIPELPSEVIPQNDNNPLKEVVFGEKGGVYTFMGGYPLPYKGFPYFELVDKIDNVKKIARGMLSGFYHRLKKRNFLNFLVLIPAIFILKDGLYACIFTFHRMIDRFKIKAFRHCDAVRELHRAFSLEVPGESNEFREIRLQIRDIVCNVLELDNAYRFRMQDIIVELDKKALQRNPKKELMRLIGIISEREKTQEIKDTWKLISYFIRFYLVLDKQLLKLIVYVLSNVNLDEVKLMPEDKQFCDKRVDYTFGFQIK